MTMTPIPNSLGPSVGDEDLLAPLRDSFRRFVQMEDAPDARQNHGLEAAFAAAFPIASASGRTQLTYVSYQLEAPRHDARACLHQGLTFATTIKVQVRYFILNPTEPRSGDIRYTRDGFPAALLSPGKSLVEHRFIKELRGEPEPKDVRAVYGDWLEDQGRGAEACFVRRHGVGIERAIDDLREQEVYFGQLPLMAQDGSFIDDGERRLLVPRSMDLWLPEDGVEKRRLVLAGEWLQHAVWRGLLVTSSDTKKRLSRASSSDPDIMPHDLINAAPLSVALRGLLRHPHPSRALDEGNAVARLELLRTVRGPVDMKKPAERADEDPGTPLPLTTAKDPSWAIADALVPFAGGADEREAGARVQRDALVPLGATSPRIMAGPEAAVASAFSIVRKAMFDGEVEVFDDATLALWPRPAPLSTAVCEPDPKDVLFFLDRYGDNPERACCKHGQHVIPGDVITSSEGASEGALALGREALCVFDPRAEGATVSREFAAAMGSRRLHRYEVSLLDTAWGADELSPTVPGAGAHLDADGIVHVGAEVSSGMPLVGVAAWAGPPEVAASTRTERGRPRKAAGSRVDGSIRVGANIVGRVVAVDIFRRRGSEPSARERAEHERSLVVLHAAQAAATLRGGTLGESVISISTRSSPRRGRSTARGSSCGELSGVFASR